MVDFSKVESNIPVKRKIAALKLASPIKFQESRQDSASKDETFPSMCVDTN